MTTSTSAFSKINIVTCFDHFLDVSNNVRGKDKSIGMRVLVLPTLYEIGCGFEAWMCNESPRIHNLIMG